MPQEQEQEQVLERELNSEQYQQLQIKKIAKYILKNCYPRQGNYFNLPIKKIDNISVIVEFTYEGNHDELSYLSCNIRLAPNIEYTMAEFLIRDFNDDFTLEQGLLLIFEKLKKLKFNKSKGLFIDPSKNNDGDSQQEENIMITVFSILKGCENISLSINECCACLELTETHTSCGHNICIACYSRLEVVKHEWREYYGRDSFYKKCPMCRSIIDKLLPKTGVCELLEQLRV
jgi:hypothetical protein